MRSNGRDIGLGFGSVGGVFTLPAAHSGYEENWSNRSKCWKIETVSDTVA